MFIKEKHNPMHSLRSANSMKMSLVEGSRRFETNRRMMKEAKVKASERNQSRKIEHGA